MGKPQAPPAQSPNGQIGNMLSDPEAVKIAKAYNDRYLHWDDLRYRDCGGYNEEDIWHLMKVLRMQGLTELDIGGLKLCFAVIRRFQKPLHDLDVALSAGSIPAVGMDEKRRMAISVGSMMEESIASSQMEGAATTTKVAKEMLRANRPPRDRSERMIINNYNAMGFIRRNLSSRITPDLIMKLHSVITHDTLESEGYEGMFRTDDSIAVRDILTGETYHEPVTHTCIEPMMQSLCQFIEDDSEFMHPIIKGIIVHFVIAYIHPFIDGNGRTARAMFYWYTMKKGYPIMQFLSISKAIKDHKGRYERAYQLSETDGNDVTYFIDYNIEMLMESVSTLRSYLDRKETERREVLSMLSSEGLTSRQIDVLASLMNSDRPKDVYAIAGELNTSGQNIRNDLNSLISKGYIVRAGSDGHRVLYAYNERRRNQNP